MRKLLFLIALTSLAPTAFGRSGNSFGPQFRKSFLPPKLSQISVGASSKDSVLQSLGRPLKQEPAEELLFYDLSGHRFDTTIEIKNQKVSSVYYRFPPGSLPIEKIKQMIPEEKWKAALRESAKANSQSHDKGREIQIHFPAEGITLTLNRIKNASVVSFYQSL